MISKKSQEKLSGVKINYEVAIRPPAPYKMNEL